MAPKGYMQVRRSLDGDGISVQSSTEPSTDGDYDIESNPGAPEERSEYTPSSSDKKIDAQAERSPLLSDLPPQYEDLTPDSIPQTAEGLDGAKLGLQPGYGQPHGDDGLPGAAELRQRRRRRCRKVCLILSLKLLVLSGLALYVLSFFGLCQMRRSGHTDRTPGEVASTEREIIIDKGSESIWGHYPLYDLLSLKTDSGSITVRIEPKPADPKHPDKPARVVIKTESGSVVVSFRTPRAASMPELDMQMDVAEMKEEHEEMKEEHEDAETLGGHHGGDETPLPPRPYELEIQTVSGNIYGRFIFSTKASLETSSGSINGVIIPVLYESLPSNISLETTTVSGHHHIRVTEPFHRCSHHHDSNSHPISQINSRLADHATASHISRGSGNVNLAYPRSWAGNVSASSGSGNIHLHGHDLDIIEEDKHHTVGVKKPDSDQKHAWWGSRGDMEVIAKSEGSGSVNYFV